ncbi:MAG TPA: DUF1501 domain-containing protein [Verrucomicrobiae bacterium]|nr:DUF1501 domain-containing protein [Verrucomicrobiae bacterium]
MNPHPLLQDYVRYETRRQFFKRGASLMGTAALAMLAPQMLLADDDKSAAKKDAEKMLRAIGPQFPPKAKQVIYLHMVGGPSQLDLFDYKPKLGDWFDKDLPDSIRKGQRITTMTSGQKRLPIAPSKYKFAQYGKNGMWISELLPWTSKMADDLCFVRSMNTEAINHEPAITFMQTGNQNTGRPCFGSWTSYGLGTMNENLPTFVVLVAKSTNTEQLQAISNRLWSAGYLPGEHAGVQFRTAGDPILFINNPQGVDAKVRRETLNGLKALNEINFRVVGDPETHTRISEYELAYRMQTSVPDLAAVSSEPESTYKLYGDAAKTPGTFANTAVLARRLVERGVRFVQIYHNNWDTHSNTSGRLPDQCKDVDQACYGLVQDLKQRGLLDSTLIVWGGEFGRTIYSQGELTKANYGRDHHPRCFTMWMAGGGIKPGLIHGETDDFSYNIVRDPVSVHDFHATALKLLGFDHLKFTYRFQGLDQRLTGVVPAGVVDQLIA